MLGALLARGGGFFARVMAGDRVAIGFLVVLAAVVVIAVVRARARSS